MVQTYLYSLLAATTLLLLLHTSALPSTSRSSTSPSHLLSDQDIDNYSASGPGETSADSWSDYGADYGGGSGGSYGYGSLDLNGPLTIPTASSQMIPQQDITVGSQTDVVPTTGVFPNLIFRPHIQLYDPLVNNYHMDRSDYHEGYDNGNDYGNDYGNGSYGNDNYSGGEEYGFDNGYGGSGSGGHILESGGYDAGESDVLNTFSGSGSQMTMMTKRQLSLVPPGPGSPGFVGKPSGMTTETLIKPIVRIQPHSLQPVPVPVSQAYPVPVPVGVSVPYSSGVGTCGFEGAGFGDDWAAGGGWGAGF
ncbi:hypothetical protein EDD11_003990 [Mortierella claussenii]|nr:hypothetical protein EDD11_003990 [Mortierella claussenii]